MSAPEMAFEFEGHTWRVWSMNAEHLGFMIGYGSRLAPDPLVINTVAYEARFDAELVDGQWRIVADRGRYNGTGPKYVHSFYLLKERVLGAFLADAGFVGLVQEGRRYSAAVVLEKEAKALQAAIASLDDAKDRYVPALVEAFAAEVPDVHKIVAKFSYP